MSSQSANTSSSVPRIDFSQTDNMVMSGKIGSTSELPSSTLLLNKYPMYTASSKHVVSAPLFGDDLEGQEQVTRSLNDLERAVCILAPVLDKIYAALAKNGCF